MTNTPFFRKGVSRVTLVTSEKSQVSHESVTIVTLNCHKCHIKLSQLSHEIVTIVTPKYHNCHTKVSQLSHENRSIQLTVSHANVTQNCHNCHAELSQTSH